MPAASQSRAASSARNAPASKPCSAGVDTTKYDWSFGASLRLGALLSPAVDLVIYNSEAGADEHVRAGYRPCRAVVIPNGVDVGRFRRDEEGRARVRAEKRSEHMCWGVQPSYVHAHFVEND